MEEALLWNLRVSVPQWCDANNPSVLRPYTPFG